jgi:glycosyltransferase involved in cell wall biosynthesis
MKISMVTANINTEPGKGIAIYTKELIDGLKKEKINIDPFFYNKGSLISMINLIPKLKHYDIIHIQHESGLFGGFAGIKFIPFLYLLSWFTYSKIVLTIHTIHEKNEKIFHRSPLWIWIRKNFFYPFINKIIAKKADALIFHTDFLSKRIFEYANIKKDKIFVIPHGVRDDAPVHEKEYAQKQLGLKSPLYLLIGNIAEQKGFDIIVKNAKKIKGNICIFGKILGLKNEKYLETIQDYIKKNNLGNKVKIDTTVDKDGGDYRKWWLYLSAADLILLPYRMMTSSGVFISAMQVKKPVITCDSPYFREIKSNYNCIKIAKKEKDYPQLIEESMGELKKMEFEASRFAKDNSFKKSSKKYNQLYQELCQKN